MSRHPTYIKLINTTKWRKIRIEKLKANPLCEECRRNDKLTLANEVHHITPVESVSGETSMERLMYDRKNLMSVCHACHKEIHKKMQSRTKQSIKDNSKRRTKTFIERFL